MANLTGSRYLFFTTSPRTPMKMLPEIEVLFNEFEGKEWNTDNQIKFMESLVKGDFFEGTGAKDLAFAARDRVNRSPKALGFVSLKPNISITEAGKEFLHSKNKEEVLLRQLLKFQLPSPYHTKSANEDNIFNVKPYLEIFRLIQKFGSLSFDEVMLFGLQMTDYNRFDEVVNKIENFRIERRKTTDSYKVFRGKYLQKIVLEIFAEDIKNGRTKLRESNDSSIKNFVKTKASTMRDYTDACFRYIRATGMVNISQRGKSLSIVPEKKEEMEFILNSIDKQPIFAEDEEKYKKYLFNPLLPKLFTDDVENLIKKIQEYDRLPYDELKKLSVLELKDKLSVLRENRKVDILDSQVKSIKDYKRYDDIVNVFTDIKNKDLYDIPLMLEWNTWRAMTMIDGGHIVANLKFDDNGEPMSTAQGNIADIVCDYGDFGLTVEVTMASGARQYEMEGEPVTRHLAKLKKDSDKNAYCLFVAPKINEACISHFYMLHKTNIKFYGGKSVIVPVELTTFEKMLEDSYKADYIPNPKHVENLFKYSQDIANNSVDEQEWYSKVTEKALNWLA